MVGGVNKGKVVFSHWDFCLQNCKVLSVGGLVKPLISYDLKNIITNVYSGDLNNTPTSGGEVRVYRLEACTNAPNKDLGHILFDLKYDSYTKSQISIKADKIYIRYALGSKWSAWNLVSLKV